LPNHPERSVNSASSFRSVRLRHHDRFERIDNRNILLVKAHPEVVWLVTDSVLLQVTSIVARYRFLVCLHLTLRPGKVLVPFVFSEDTFVLISLTPPVVSVVSHPCICDPVLLS
jgi:hypothetical protein